MRSIIIPVIIFTFSMAITPGPNNVMLTSSGARFGFRRTIPHISGVIFGMTCLYILSAFGLGSLFYLFPVLQVILKAAGSLYLLFMAFKISFSGQSVNTVETAEPLNIFQAAVFQLLNPKAFIITITAISTYTLEGKMYVPSTLIIILSFIVIGTVSISIWAGFGSLIGNLLKNKKSFRAFNISMGLLTAFTVFMIIR